MAERLAGVHDEWMMSPIRRRLERGEQAPPVDPALTVPQPAVQRAHQMLNAVNDGDVETVKALQAQVLSISDRKVCRELYRAARTYPALREDDDPDEEPDIWNRAMLDVHEPRPRRRFAVEDHTGHDGWHYSENQLLAAYDVLHYSMNLVAYHGSLPILKAFIGEDFEAECRRRPAEDCARPQEENGSGRPAKAARGAEEDPASIPELPGNLWDLIYFRSRHLLERERLKHRIITDAFLKAIKELLEQDRPTTYPFYIMNEIAKGDQWRWARRSAEESREAMEGRTRILHYLCGTFAHVPMLRLRATSIALYKALQARDVTWCRYLIDLFGVDLNTPVRNYALDPISPVGFHHFFKHSHQYGELNPQAHSVVVRGPPLRSHELPLEVLCESHYGALTPGLRLLLSYPGLDLRAPTFHRFRDPDTDTSGQPGWSEKCTILQYVCHKMRASVEDVRLLLAHPDIDVRGVWRVLLTDCLRHRQTWSGSGLPGGREPAPEPPRDSTAERPGTATRICRAEDTAQRLNFGFAPQSRNIQPGSDRMLEIAKLLSAFPEAMTPEDINCTNDKGESLFLANVDKASDEFILWMVARPEVEAGGVDRAGQGLLHKLCARRSAEFVSALLQHPHVKRHINRRDLHGRNALDMILHHLEYEKKEVNESMAAFQQRLQPMKQVLEEHGARATEVPVVRFALADGSEGQLRESDCRLAAHAWAALLPPAPGPSARPAITLEGVRAEGWAVLRPVMERKAVDHTGPLPPEVLLQVLRAAEAHGLSAVQAWLISHVAAHLRTASRPARARYFYKPGWLCHEFSTDPASRMPPREALAATVGGGGLPGCSPSFNLLDLSWSYEADDLAQGALGAALDRLLAQVTEGKLCPPSVAELRAEGRHLRAVDAIIGMKLQHRFERPELLHGVWTLKNRMNLQPFATLVFQEDGTCVKLTRSQRVPLVFDGAGGVRMARPEERPEEEEAASPLPAPAPGSPSSAGPSSSAPSARAHAGLIPAGTSAATARKATLSFGDPGTFEVLPSIRNRLGMGLNLEFPNSNARRSLRLYLRCSSRREDDWGLVLVEMVRYETDLVLQPYRESCSYSDL